MGKLKSLIQYRPDRADEQKTFDEISGTLHILCEYRDSVPIINIAAFILDGTVFSISKDVQN